ncbi:hypothetical protein [Halalkalicoccus sp. NIPERK01]|uniref:hypothetical protein n=1 Tax=Halalkalicoccus sp. NIPERK01 TaxID=3053469 RepID=UPI00256ED888|nr:hypothetical protein [Halalkalicoccus sp. NIPERK01]MDL5362546.1 hypothetical protein [Halalkalicoccus sp. NIPERK01]
MTRFRAESDEERRTLFADAIAAHRARESPFCTLEAEADEPTWIQVGEGDGDDDPASQPASDSGAGLVNLDCTDGELDRLESLLNEFPDFSIESLTSPENAAGTNVRVGTFADEDRLAGFVERCFRTVYERPADYVAWATEV